jgi:hypothetical protein
VIWEAEVDARIIPAGKSAIRANPTPDERREIDRGGHVGAGADPGRHELKHHRLERVGLCTCGRQRREGWGKVEP